jgi:uncharacterized protein (DUF2252 family)
MQEKIIRENFVILYVLFKDADRWTTEYEVLTESHWKEETEALGQKRVMVLLWPS